MRLIGDELRAHKDALGTLVTLETGKIKPEGDGEVQEMIDIADFAVGQSRMLYGLTMHSERPHASHVRAVASARRRRHHQRVQFPGRRVVVECVPRGGVRRCLRVEALAEGAAVCGRRAAARQSRAASATGFPASSSCSSAQAHELAEKFVDDRRVDLVSFTGSTAVGRKVGERVAARLGKSLLELGGNNAIIVDEFANLDLAVPSIVFGAVGTAGQRCTSTRRVFVHESRSKELKQRLLRAYAQVRIGNPLESGTLMGPLIDAARGARATAGDRSRAQRRRHGAVR